MRNGKKHLLATSAFLAATAIAVPAQTAETQKRPPQRPVVIEKRAAAPQVITVLHRINGITMLRALIRSGQPIGAFENFEDAAQMKGGVHTNIIAGLALEDGETIAAWLPEAEVELEPWFPQVPPPDLPHQPAAPASTMVAPAIPTPAIAAPTSVFGSTSPNEMDGQPDVTIIERDGKSYAARFIGFDGFTGLSLLKISGRVLPARPIKVEVSMTVGQRMRLYSPEPVSELGAATTNSIYVRLGESVGQIVGVTKTGTGEIRRLRIRANKLSASNIGAVAVNDSGETIGIVESIRGGEAIVLAPAAIRAAAKRVLARQMSVPRPWLGVSGEPLAFTSVDRMIKKGWDMQRAMSLFQTQRGIMLNFVAPNSPAALAALRAGDVIVGVNDDEVKSTDDFSLLLAEAAAKPVRFSVVRRNGEGPEPVVVQLSQEMDASARMFDLHSRVLPGNPLVEQGIETVPLRSLASPHEIKRGLLVIYVQPGSAAFKSGLLTGDIIEEIQNQPVSTITSPKLELPMPYSLTILRNKEKIVITVSEMVK